MTRILKACCRLGASLPNPRVCGIHRDFYADQVIVGEGRIYLIDFDLYCVGDPALDVGNFLGHLTEQALRLMNDPDGLLACEFAVEESYMASASKNLRPAIQAYKTLTLARHLFISTQFEERRASTLPLFDLCEERLHSAE